MRGLDQRNRPVSNMYCSKMPRDGEGPYDQHPLSWYQPKSYAQHPPSSKSTSNWRNLFFTFVFDTESGEVTRECSPVLEKFNHGILDTACEELCNYIRNNVLGQSLKKATSRQKSGAEVCPQEGHFENDTIFEDGVKRSRPGTLSAESPNQNKLRPSKSRKLRSKAYIPNKMDIASKSVTPTQSEHEGIRNEVGFTFKVSETDELVKWLAEGFRTVQQIGCRTIAKEWIKLIHPKKQSTHPYNGRKLKAGIGNPESTRPDWWPKSVIHKEPDHINKEERTNLLVELLMGTPHKVVLPPGQDNSVKMVDAQALLESLEGKCDDPKHGLQTKRSAIGHIIRVRKNMESFEEGGMTADTTVDVFDWTTYRKHSVNEDDAMKDNTDEIVEDSTQDDDYNEDMKMSFSSSTGNDDPSQMSDMMLIQARKNVPRGKSKKRLKQQEFHFIDTGLTGRTMQVGFPPTYIPYGMAQPPNSHMQNVSPHSWASAVQTPAQMAQYQYPFLAPPEHKIMQASGPYMGDDMEILPMQQPIYSGMSYIPGPSLMNMRYDVDQQGEGFDSNPQSFSLGVDDA